MISNFSNILEVREAKSVLKETSNLPAEKDTPETLDYEKMAKVVEGVFRMLR